MSTPSPTSQVQLKRPATIEIRFNNQGQYKKYITFYQKALGLPALSTIPEPVYSIPVGLMPVNATTPDMELRFVLLKNGATKNKPDKVRTIVYWQVSSADLIATQQSLKKNLGYDAIDSTISTQGIGPQFLLLQAADPISPVASPIKTASQDGDGNSMGLVINPPYPRYSDTPPPQPGPGFLPGTSLGIGMLGLALGVGLGLLVARLFRSKTAPR